MDKLLGCCLDGRKEMEGKKLERFGGMKDFYLDNKMKGNGFGGDEFGEIG